MISPFREYVLKYPPYRCNRVQNGVINAVSSNDKGAQVRSNGF